ncbi:putative 6-phosphofructo-2-kinase/fructose-2,6-biphosphatase [Trypanosoma rangeli]|uniref:Putative 6-phosphofructo-2-kinase/fructose-2,6-biphosphatase n=1 Tax=Trypanosoma rangeli TaxID=5698 RepID=A0A422NHK9_TRYRA|nr:putative 6-phosphofructo-2-kinase/fructose-2,6-biphosphatase [Trypanosoma rangeli]RNF04956.1 putative 6-phosphofructo-2-kinase/fructose-2,6-biphosphatase [Trypanosoma rangeli]|eukprot:RNF04956.1 putative 6-phosphofructo-2-kinase/fructose-2,6-biphosphatase [Trypanosoma rangeli]
MNSVSESCGSDQTSPQLADDEGGDATLPGKSDGAVAAGTGAQVKMVSERPEIAATAAATKTTTTTTATVAPASTLNLGCPGCLQPSEGASPDAWDKWGYRADAPCFCETVVLGTSPSSPPPPSQNANVSLVFDALPQSYSLVNSFSGYAYGRVSNSLLASTRTCPEEVNPTTTLENGLTFNEDDLREPRRYRATSFPTHSFCPVGEMQQAFLHQLSCAERVGGSVCSTLFRPCFRSRLQPLASIKDPHFARTAREQNRSMLISVLVCQKQSLQRQLEAMRKQFSEQNIFSMVRASKASQLQYLLDNKLCDVNKRDYNGCTPLHVAALEGNEVIVRLLLSFGADIMAMDNTGRTPLDWAAANRHSGVCRYLLHATQQIMLLHEQQKEHEGSESEHVDFTDKNAGRSQVFSLSVATNSAMQSLLLSPPIQASKKLSAMQSLSLDSETGSEQQNDVASASLMACLPPDVMSMVQTQYHLASCHSAEDGVQNEDEVEEEEDEAEEEYATAKFSSYTTISDPVPLVVCMVGLPGRGKSFIARRLSRYLNWKGVPCRVFNAGSYRRQLLGVEGTADAGFFDPNNAKGSQLREKMAQLACEDLLEFISQHRAAVGVFDATNTTRARRRHLIEFFTNASKQRNVECRVVFIESICTDDNIITENILRSKCGNDDFKNVGDISGVISSFRSRIAEYEKVYEPLDRAEDLSFIRIVNVKQHVVVQNIPCGLASRIAFFLLNLHPVAYPVYIALPGETEGESNHIYGGDEHLTPLGEKFALALRRFILERYVPNMIVLHGTNCSVVNTLKPLAESLRDDSEDGVTRVEDEENVPFSALPSQEELLCPLPGLDSINYGWFSGRTVRWVQKRYAKLSRILFAAVPGSSDESLSSMNISPNSHPEDVESNAQGGKESLGPSHQGDQDGEHVPTQHFGNNAKAILRFRHVPNGTDPRLSYCVQFPNGESCRQVNVRLEPALMAVMRVQGPVVVVATSVPAQGVLAFMADVLPELSPTLRLPKHAVVEIGVKGDITVHQLEPAEDGLCLDT